MLMHRGSNALGAVAEDGLALGSGHWNAANARRQIGPKARLEHINHPIAMFPPAAGEE